MLLLGGGLAKGFPGLKGVRGPPGPAGTLGEPGKKGGKLGAASIIFEFFWRGCKLVQRF